MLVVLQDASMISFMCSFYFCNSCLTFIVFVLTVTRVLFCNLPSVVTVNILHSAVVSQGWEEGVYFD